MRPQERRGKVKSKPRRKVRGHVSTSEGHDDAFREVNQLNSAIISGAHEGIVLYDRRLNYRIWNRFMEELTGVHAEKVLGKNALELFPHIREQDVDLLLNRALRGEMVTSPDTPFHVAASGKSGWISGVYGPLRDANGEITGVIALVRDVTERRKAEAVLRDSEERYRAIFDGTNDGLYFLDERGRFLDANKVACERLGYSRDELLKMSVRDVNAPESAGLVAQRIKEIRERGFSVFEAREVKRDGSSFPVEVSARPFTYKGQQAVLGIVRDVTERKRTEELLQVSERNLRGLFNATTESVMLMTLNFSTATAERLPVTTPTT